MSISIQEYKDQYAGNGYEPKAILPEQYAVKKKLQAAQSHLFDSHEGLDKLGAGRWITIGSEKDEDGESHGGHRVFIGSDGEMKTGKFAGQTFKEAFGKKPSDNQNKPTVPKTPEKEESKEPEVDSSVPDNFVEAKTKSGRLDEAHKQAGKVLSSLPGVGTGSLGLTPDHVKASPEYKQAKSKKEQAWERLREFNSVYTKKFEKELREERGRKTEAPMIEFAPKTKPNAEAKEGDQLGLFGEATNAPKPSKVFKPTITGSNTAGKQQGLFDTHGNSDQMDLFGDGVMDESLVYKPVQNDPKPAESQAVEQTSKKDVLLDESDLSSKEAPKADFSLRDRAGKAFTTNAILNNPQSLNDRRLLDAYDAIDPKQHEALHAFVATHRPDLLERSKSILANQPTMRSTAPEANVASVKPWSEMTRKEQEQHTNARWEKFFKNTLKPGDTVSVLGGNPVTVKRVNAKSISTTTGSTWPFSQIGLYGVSPQEAVKKLNEFENSPAASSGRLLDAIKKDLRESVTSAEGLEKVLKPESLESIKNASPDSVGNHVEQIAKLAPGAKRTDIRNAIEEYRKKHGVESPKEDEKKPGLTMTVNSVTPHVDEIAHALDHVENHGGSYKIINPKTGAPYPYSVYDSKNAAINSFINKQRAEATNGTEYSGGFTRVRGDYRSWLKSHGVKESDLTGIDAKKLKKEAEAKALASKTWGLDDLKDHLNKLDRGEVTAEEHKNAFKLFQDNKAAIQAELGKLKKDDIEGWHHEDGMRTVSLYKAANKDSAIKAKINSLERSFDLTGASNSWTFGEDRKAKTHAAIDKVTDEHIAGHASDWAKHQEERKAERKAAKERRENPQTASDWRERRIEAGGYLNLSPEEQAKHDDAYAQHRRNMRPFKAPVEKEVRQLTGGGKDLGFELSKNFHSKRGHDIFTASPSDRVDKDSYREMESAAKKLGGWYYKKFGNTPSGFHFPTEEARSQFLSLQQGSVDRSAEAEASQAAKQENQAARLSELAESQRERAEAKLNAPRQDNTFRRASMAANAERDARKNIALAGTLQNIADHIADGKAVHLQHLKNRAQLEELESHLHRAKWEAIRHAEKHDASYKNLPYQERENRINGETKEHDIAHAKFPYPYLHASEADSAASTLASVPGLKTFAGSLRKMAGEIRQSGEDYGQIMDAGHLDKIRDALPKMRSHKDPSVRHIAGRFAEKLDSMKRLESMDIQNSHELKAALRELHGLRQKEAGADPIKEAERKLKREKIEGFFPTPKTLIQKMLDHADIEEGHEVLEPSAGIGSIMDAVKERHPKANLHGIEQNFSIAEVLGLKGHSHDRGDFLEHSKKYDRIIMNPPFENRQDEKHVRHAYDLLKPGGKMVAIMGAGAHTNPRSENFREWLGGVGGRVYDTPEGAFNTDEAFRKTGVNTKMVVITKPHDETSSRYSTMYVPGLIARQSTDEVLSLPERYHWNEKLHPRHPAGTSQGGRFSPSNSQSGSNQSNGNRKVRDIPDAPDRTSHHSLSFNKQPGNVQLRLGDSKRSLAALVATATRVAHDRAGGDNFTSDDVWELIDKKRLQYELDLMNKYNRESIENGGPRFDELCNYNGVIPKFIAERLAGGSRFFDPTHLRGRWHEPAPEPEEATPQSTEEPKSSQRISEEQFDKAKAEDLPTGLSKQKLNKLDAQIRSSIADDDGVVEAFRPIVIEAWQQLTNDAKAHNSAIREMTSATARTLGEKVDSAGHSTGAMTMQKLSAMVRKARNGDLDPSKKKGFDELVDLFERNYPHMLQGRGEDGLLDLLAEGIKPMPDILDESVADRAVELAGREMFESLQHGTPDSSFNVDEFEQIPFSWVNAAMQVSIWRYQHAKRCEVERYTTTSLGSNSRVKMFSPLLMN